MDDLNPWGGGLVKPRNKLIIFQRLVRPHVDILWLDSVSHVRPGTWYVPVQRAQKSETKLRVQYIIIGSVPSLGNPRMLIEVIGVWSQDVVGGGVFPLPLYFEFCMPHSHTFGPTNKSLAKIKS